MIGSLFLFLNIELTNSFSPASVSNGAAISFTEALYSPVVHIDCGAGDNQGYDTASAIF